MGIKFDERYGFVDEVKGDVLRAKYISQSPPVYRVWDLEGGVWEATGEARPLREAAQISLQSPFASQGGVTWENQSNAYAVSLRLSNNPPATVPLAQHWSLKRVPRPPAPVIKDDDTGIANEFLIGCDPEAAAIGEAARVYTNPKTWARETVMEAVPVRVSDYGIPFTGPVGYDHNGAVLELRPSPFRGTYALTQELRKIITKHPMMVALRGKGLKLRAGGFLEGHSRSITMGGHIHLGLAPSQKMTQALDRVTNYLEKLDVFPERECNTRRSLGSYGHLGDVRTPEDSFGDLRVEYRPMPSWLYDPKVTFMALTTAKLAALDPDHALNRLKARAIDWSHLTGWVDDFAPKDANAARLATFIDARFAGKPDVDVFEVWERPLAF